MKDLSEVKVLTEEDVDSLYILQWPPGIQPEEETFVIPVARRKGGVLLGVPLGVLDKKDLDDGALSSTEDLMVGPSKLVTVPGVEEDEHGADIPSGVDVTLLLVDFNDSVLPLIREYNPAQDQHEIQSLLEDAPQVVPSSTLLLQTALEWMNDEVSGRVHYYSAEENAVAPVAAPKMPFPAVPQQSTVRDFAQKVGAAPKTKATPVPVIKLDAQDHELFHDDPNIPAADLQEAFNAAADPPTLTQAIFQQSQAMNAMVAHLVGSQDPLTDLAASSSTSLSTKGAGRREKLQQLLANRSGDFFLQVCHQALRRIKPLDPLPTSLKDLPRKAIFSKYMEKQGGMAGQRDFALMMWLL